eukprot:1439021-Pleurochrysis_carterae.AAC.1
MCRAGRSIALPSSPSCCTCSCCCPAPVWATLCCCHERARGKFRRFRRSARELRRNREVFVSEFRRDRDPSGSKLG